MANNLKQLIAKKNNLQEKKEKYLLEYHL